MGFSSSVQSGIPSSKPSLKPSTCSPCDDEPTRGMKEKDNKCSEIVNIEERCRKNSWKNNKYCAQTCFNAGEPYEGMFCCSESPSVVPSTFSSSVQSGIPSSKPSLKPSSCTPCDDEPTRGMKEKDNKCNEIPNIEERCRKNSWKNNKYC